MKNVTIFKIKEDSMSQVLTSIEQGSELFEDFKFKPLGDTEQRKLGFVVPKTLKDTIDPLYADFFNNGFLLEVKEQKKVPEKYLVEELIEQMTETELALNGEEKLPKSIEERIKIEATQEVLKNTSPKKPNFYNVYINAKGLIFVEAKGKLAEDIISLIRKTIGSLPCVPFVESGDFEPSKVSDLLDNLITETISGKFTLGNKASLTSPEGVKYSLSKGSLYESDAGDNVKSNQFMVNNLELEYDGTVKFTLDEGLVLSGVKFDKDFFTKEELLDEAGTLVLKIQELSGVVAYLQELLIEE